MTPFTPAPKPTPALPAKRTRPNPISAKQSAKRKANGEQFLGSTISKPKSVVKIRSVNVKAAKKRKESYRKKLAAYRKSECYKQVEARAQDRCEQIVNGERCFLTRGEPWNAKLQHHHKTYQRFGGKELPEDIQLLCVPHHHYAESLARPWNKGSFERGKE